MKEKIIERIDIEYKRSPEEILAYLQELQQANGIKWVGFDVFDTLIKSLYTDRKIMTVLSRIFSGYFESKSVPVSKKECLEEYSALRQKIRTYVSRLRIDIPLKEQETNEGIVIESFGKLYFAFANTFQL